MGRVTTAVGKWGGQLLGPQLLAQLERWELVSRKIFRGRTKGERRSKRKGQSVACAAGRGREEFLFAELGEGDFGVDQRPDGQGRLREGAAVFGDATDGRVCLACAIARGVEPGSEGGFEADRLRR